jgi:RNA-directed DNA polymerase
MEENRVEKFLAIRNKRELAAFLKVEYKVLAYNLYKLNDDEKYIEFEIKKRKGGQRQIIAPNSGIKFIQKNLSKILLDIYPVKGCVHGYVKSKSIKSNALVHVKRKNIINIDLEDFFPSINFGRVRGIFKSFPFNFNDTIATAIAQICCYKGILPQGAPTSPIISNFICYKLDNKLIDLAIQGRFSYTRYADDITFSSNIFPIPKEIGEIFNNRILLSENIIEVIRNNGFKINNEKSRVANRSHRQEVTGIIVNKFPNVKRNYIRQVRAMLNAWEKYGIYEAAREHFEKYNYKNKKTIHLELSYQNELVGKIGYVGMIRGKDDFIYKKLYERIKHLNPQVHLSIVQKVSENSRYPIIFGEGRTDWKHLKAALSYYKSIGDYISLDVSFHDYQEVKEINNDGLIKICEGLSKTSFHKTKIICIFDRDDKGINNKACEKNKDYRDWGNNVYSVLLPIPDHRNFNEICIEHYYNDDEIKILDKNGRRLFLSDEFDKNTGVHKTDNVIFVRKNILKSNYPRIIDNSVVNPDNGDSMALSKSSFADYILNNDTIIKNIKFEHFRSIFDLISEILKK